LATEDGNDLSKLPLAMSILSLPWRTSVGYSIAIDLFVNNAEDLANHIEVIGKKLDKNTARY